MIDDCINIHFESVAYFLYSLITFFSSLSLLSLIYSITTGLILLNIAAQRINGLNLRIVSYCCIFEISKNN